MIFGPKCAFSTGMPWLALRCCLLLRLGEGQLAVRVALLPSLLGELQARALRHVRLERLRVPARGKGSVAVEWHASSQDVRSV